MPSFKIGDTMNNNVVSISPRMQESYALDAICNVFKYFSLNYIVVVT